MFNYLEQFEESVNRAREAIVNAHNVESVTVHIYISQDSNPQLEYEISELVDTRQ